MRITPGSNLEKIVNLHLDGKGPVAIGKELGMPYTTVGDLINRYTDKFKCEVCGVSVGSSFHLSRHNESERHLKRANLSEIKSETESKILNNKLPSYVTATQLSKACLQLATKFEEIANAFKVLESTELAIEECERIKDRMKGLVQDKKMIEKKMVERAMPIYSEDSLNERV